MTLLEYEQSSIQGRCISLVTQCANTTLDLLFDTADKRNAVLTVLDLCVEWYRAAARAIRSSSPSRARRRGASGAPSR